MNRSIVLVTLTSTMCACGGGGDPASTPDASTPDPSTFDYAACLPPDTDPDPACVDGACAEVGIEQRFYARLKAQGIALTGLTEDEWRDRIRIRRLEGGDSGAIFFEYILQLGWFRSRTPRGFILTEDPSDAITDAHIDAALDDPEWVAHWGPVGAHDAVLPRAQVEAVAHGCQADIALRWCETGHDDLGRLTVNGSNRDTVVGSNDCVYARVDVFTGELLECRPQDCFEDE